jgi:hypothetical protein
MPTYTVIIENGWSYITRLDGYREGPIRYRWEAQEWADEMNRTAVASEQRINQYTEAIAWGAAEDAARKSDISAVKSGAMTLEEAQKRARSRKRQSGLRPTEAYDAMCEAQRRARSQ